MIDTRCGGYMTPAKPIRILIVDDLPVVRSGLKLCIRSFDDLELAGEAASGDEAVQLCHQIQPDVVLLDLDMPGLCSVAALRLIRFSDPQIQVVAMSSFQGENMVQPMLDNGAIGSLLKNVTSDDLACAIRTAYHQARPEREAIAPVFSPRPSVPCKGQTCPWGWNCRPLND